MFGQNASRNDFEREVVIEVEYLKSIHGDEALEVARGKAARPRLRSERRRILNAAVRRLEAPGKPPKQTLLNRLFG